METQQPTIPLSDTDDQPGSAVDTDTSRSRWFSFTAIAATLIALALMASGLATVGVLAGYSPVETDVTTAIWLLNLDLVLALALIAVLTRKMVNAWVSRRHGSAGSKLHIRLVASFSLVAVIPALLVAAFSGLFLNFGIETWFSERVRTAVNESKLVAEAYLEEHQQNIGGAALGMANDINRAARSLLNNPRILGDIMQTQSAVRELSEAVVVDSRGNTLARTGFGFSLGFNFSSDGLIKGVLNSRPGEVVIIRGSSDDRVLAGVKLEAFNDAYLLVGRFVKPRVLDHLSRTRGATAQYSALEQSRESLQLKFLLVFGVVALLLLLAAIWIGWSLATQLASPIGNLIDAAERVRKGDLEARVSESHSERDDEIGRLGKTFNRMTAQLENQQSSLIEANRQLDERRRFTETVLSGVSAGVIGLNKDGVIQLHNQSANELLELDLGQLTGEALNQVVPVMSDLLASCRRNPDRNSQGEVRHAGSQRQKTLLVSIAAEKLRKEIIGFVITFDDVTELLSAQRKAAWADVARRIAHEIKNPLTPIQLSAERLKRKYAKEITSDKETFDICTDTIVRQVEDIGRMVDEFSSFARMPQPDMKLVNLVELCRQSVFLERNRYPEIAYNLDLDDEPVTLQCDRQQISQVLTNLLKNAAESVSSDIKKNGEERNAGTIALKLESSEDLVSISIVDNGKGFPEDLLDRITEPYVTTREKGTGLGLAIAKKIMEDHSGELLLSNNAGEGAGAQAVLKFTRATQALGTVSSGTNEAGQSDLEAVGT